MATRIVERDGLLTRTVTPSVPVRVDYALTPLGQSLIPWPGRNTTRPPDAGQFASA